jgi:putative PIN family toxin of toxin-antitoxin system
VLDTDVIVAAMRSPTGASAELLRQIDAGKLVMILSVALTLEYEATCQRAEHRLVAGLSAAEVETFIDGLVALAERVKLRFRWRPQLRDAGDEMVLEAAVNGPADGIVTFNSRDFGEAPARFGVEVLKPMEVLWRLRA